MIAADVLSVIGVAGLMGVGAGFVADRGVLLSVGLMLLGAMSGLAFHYGTYMSSVEQEHHVLEQIYLNYPQGKELTVDISMGDDEEHKWSPTFVRMANRKIRQCERNIDKQCKVYLETTQVSNDE